MARGKKTGGRQKGTPNKMPPEAKALYAPHSAEACDTIIRLMRTSDNEMIRLAAAKEVTDRAHGKARQPLAHEGLQPAKLAIVNITNRAEMQALLGQGVDADAGDDSEDGDT